jgi:RNA polymerase sigma factor FliA
MQSSHVTTQSKHDQDVVLICDHLPLVGHMVRELSARLPRHVSLEDLRAAGMLALVQAARSFDPALRVPFASFATCRIRGGLLDELRRMDWATRSVRRRERQVESMRAELKNALRRMPTDKEIAAASGLTTSELHEHDKDLARASVTSIDALCELDRSRAVGVTSIEPIHVLMHRERMAYLSDAVQQLPPRMRTAVEGHFLHDRPMGELAEELGVTASRVSQMCAEALALMRHALDCLLEQAEPSGADATAGVGARRRAAYVHDVARVRPALARLDRVGSVELTRPA